MRAERRERAGLAALFVAGLLLRLALAQVTPPFQAPDEEAHFRFVDFVAEERALPVQPPRDLERDLDFWPQYYQPPLAYLLFLPLDATLRGVGLDEAGRVRGLRFQNAVVASLAVLLAFAVASRLAPAGDPRRLGIPLVVALLPGFAANGASVNNDTLANLLAAALWLPLLSADRQRGAWQAGLVFGAACLAKLTVLSQAPLLFLVPWLARRDDPAGALRFAFVAGAIAGAMLAPWLVRNTFVYGDPLAIGVGSISLEWLAGQLPAEKVAELSGPRPGHAFEIFFGKVGIFHNLHFAAAAWAGAALGLLSLAGWLRRAPADALSARGLAFLAAPLLAAVGLTWFSIRFYGGWQGRYLFTAVLPVAALWAVGWQRLAGDDPRRGRVLFAAAAVLLVGLGVWLVLAVQRFFLDTPPLRWSFSHAL